MFPIVSGIVGQVVVDTTYTLREISVSGAGLVGSSPITELITTPDEIILARESGSNEKLLAYSYDDTDLPNNFGTVANELAVSNQNPRAITFGDSGNYLYIGGNASPYLQRRELNTAYDISTAGTTTSKNTSSSYGWGAQGLDFKSDGSILFAAEGNNIRVCNLSTNWDITSINGTPSTVALSGQNDDDGDKIEGLTGVRFRPDGTKFWVCYRHASGNTITTENNPKIAEFALSTAWDLSTKSFVSSIDFGIDLGTFDNTNFVDTPTLPAGFGWNSDGTALFICGVHIDVHEGEVIVLKLS